MNIYSDYEKIVPKEKLHQFLFDFFRTREEKVWIKDAGDELFCQTLQSAIKKYNKHRLLIDLVDKFFLKLYANKRKKKILFLPFKYFDIVLGARKYHQAGLIVDGRNRLVAIKNFMGYITTDDLDQYFLAYLKEKDIKYLYLLIKGMEDKLRAANPDCIVLWNDILPMERAIVLASKKLGIATLEIQHGFYNSSFPLKTGRVVDYVLVWGKYFKDLYIKQGGRKPEDIYVLGYPYLIKKNQELEKKNNHYTVCYLGQNFETFNKDFLSAKLETIIRIYEICKKLNLNFIYRPHPGDNRELLKKNLADIQFTDMGEGLEETFKKADIFISFLSTSLIESAMRKKISLQLMNYPIKLEKSDNFEELGVCNKTLQTFDELENYLKEIISAPSLDKFKLNFNNDYVETRYDPVERLSEIIKEIESIKKLKII